MATMDLVGGVEQFIVGNDCVVIVNNLESYRGGRTLDATGYAPKVIPAGSLVIRETATGEFKPMPVTGTVQPDGSTLYAYDTLPSGHEYVGVVVASVPTTRPMVGIMYNGTVNPNASPYAVDALVADVVAALPQLTFKAD